MSEHAPAEMMIVAAARALAGARTVFVGVGLPNIACTLAQRTVAPDLELIYESGIYGARPARLPLSIGDPTSVSGALSICSMADLFGLYLQGGRVEVAFLGGAQIDRYGSLNTTVIGSSADLQETYAHPKVRLPGSGGACEIAIHALQIFIIMRLSRRAFVERLDFVTSPGHIGGASGKVLRGQGPQLVVTDRCIFTFDAATGEMVLHSLYAGVEVAEVQDNVGWELAVAEHLIVTEPPTVEELSLLRDRLDPQGIYTRG